MNNSLLKTTFGLLVFVILVAFTSVGIWLRFEKVEPNSFTDANSENRVGKILRKAEKSNESAAYLLVGEIVDSGGEIWYGANPGILSDRPFSIQIDSPRGSVSGVIIKKNFDLLKKLGTFVDLEELCLMGMRIGANH